jgi:hypothetical protein
MADAPPIPTVRPSPTFVPPPRTPQVEPSVAPNFTGELGYFPTSRVVHGTLENKLVRENWYTSDLGRKFGATQDAAARWKASYDTKMAAYQEQVAAKIKAGVEPKQISMIENAGLQGSAPKLNGHVRFLYEMGNNKEEQWSEIAYRNHRNEYLQKKYEDLGFAELIKKNPRLMDPGEHEGLFRQMDALGYFSHNNVSQEAVDEEKKDFMSYIDDKYAGRYGVSLYQNIKDKYEDKTQERAATTFVSQIMSGRKISALNPVDMKDYLNLKQYNEKHPGKLWEGAGNMAKHLTQAFLDTYKNTAEGFVKPEIVWNDNWKNATGANAAKKDKFLKVLDELKKADVNGDLGSFSDYGRARKMEEGLNGKGDFDDFTIEDSSKKIPDVLLKFAELYQELDKEDAFIADDRFIAPIASNLAGSIMGFSSLLTLPFSIDPNSLWSRGLSNVQAAGYATGAELYNLALWQQDNVEEWDAIVNKYGFNNFANGVAVTHEFENWTKSGWPLPSTWYREDIGRNAMMWEDPTVIGGMVVKGFKWAKMAKGFTAAEMLEKTAQARTATIAGIERLAREQVAIPAGVQSSIDAAKARILATTGKEVDDYAALQKIYDGEAIHFDINATTVDPATGKTVPVMTDGKKGKWVAYSSETLQQITNEINSSYNNARAVRSALIRTVRDSKVLTYPKTITDVLEPVRAWLVQNEKKTIDWNKASHKQILEAIDEGLIDSVDINGFGPSQRKLLNVELSKLKGEINGLDKAAYARGGANAVRLSWMTHNPITNGIRDAFGWVGDKADYWTELAGHYAGDVQSVEITKRLAETGRVGYGQQTIISSGTTLSVQKTWVRAKSMTLFANVIGWVGDSVGIAQDYIMAHKMGVGATEGSVLLGMADEYAQRAAQATKELASLDPLNRTINYQKKADNLMKIIGDCQDKFQFIKKYHSYTGAGIFDFGADLMANGGSHMAMNEAMFQFFNDQSAGAGIGAGVFFGSKNIISKHSVDKLIPSADSYIKSQTMRGRTNLTLNEINSYLPNLEPQQQGNVIEILQAEYIRAKQIHEKGAKTESERYWMHAVETMANLFRSANKVSFYEKGTIRGIEAIYRNKRAAENPEFQQQLLEGFLKDAESNGLTGDKAHSWALAQIEQLNVADAAALRVAALTDQIAIIEAARNKMLDVNDSALHKLEQAAISMAKDLNLDINSLFVHPIGSTSEKSSLVPGSQTIPPLEAFGKDFPAPKTPEEAAAQTQERMVLRTKAIMAEQNKVDVINPDGTVTKGNDLGFDNANGDVFIGDKAVQDLVDTGVITKDAQKRIIGFKKEFIRIRQARIKIGASVREANIEMQKLTNERHSAESVTSGRPFREGEVIYSAADRTQITTMKKGITVWNKFSKDGKKVIETQIYLDKDIYNTATAREEIAHALTYTENMARARARINTHLLGQWERNPNTGIYEERIPSLWGSGEEGIKRMDMFAKAYSESLGIADKVDWLTRYEQGKTAFRNDKSQSARLSAVMEEIIGQMYVQRSATLSPFSSRGKYSPSSPTGTWNGSANTAGETKGRLFMKMLLGDVTVNDFIGNTEADLISTRYTNLGLGKKPEDLSYAENQARETYAAATAAVRFFGKGGNMDKLMQLINYDRLRELGMLPEKNDSPNPFKHFRKLLEFVTDHPDTARSRAVTLERFWDTAQAFNADGTPNLVRKEFNSSIDMMIADTRNHKSSIPIIELEDNNAIRGEELDLGPEAMGRRVRWAASSGRVHWLNANGSFKKPFHALMGMEANPLGEAFTHMLLTGEETKTAFGIELVRKKGQSKDESGIIMTGSPTLEQWHRLRDYIRANTLAGEGEALAGLESGQPRTAWRSETAGLNARLWETMDLFFTSIAEGSADAKNAANPQWLRVFTGEYESVFESKGVGIKGSRRIAPDQIGTRSTIRKFAPYKITVEESGLDADGFPFLNEKGEPIKKMVMYGWVADIDAKFERTEAAWLGELKDKHGEFYWEAGDMQKLFGTRKNMIAAMKVVMSNLAATARDGTPDKRSWKALTNPPDVTMPDGSTVKTPAFAKNKADARHMADVIFRVIGFHTNQYHQQYRELTNVEISIKREGAKKNPDMALIAKLQAEAEAIGAKIDESTHSDYQTSLAKLGSEDPYTNELGDTPMWDKTTIFTKVRLDRFKQKPIAIEQLGLNGEEYGVSINMSARGNDLGGIGFSQNTWRDIPSDDIAGVASSHEMGGFSIATGHYHDSGYKTFLTSEVYATGPNKGKPKGQPKYMLFGPRQERIPGLFDTKEIAFRIAESHSAENVGKAGMDNPVEQGLAGIGWKPLSMKYVAGVRDRFISPDGVWELRKEDYTSFGSPFSLYHTETGIRVDKSIKLSFNKGKNALFIENQLKYAIEFAEKTNQVETIIRDNRLQQYKNEDIAVLHLVSDPTAENPKARKREVKYPDNIVFYDFMRKLKQNPTGDLTWAAEVRDLMIAELGDQVLTSDQGKTLEWIHSWVNSADFGHFKVEPVPGANPAPANVAEATQGMYTGYKPGEVPTERQIAPSSLLTANADRSESALIQANLRDRTGTSTAKPRVGRKPERGQFTEELPYQEALKLYLEEWKQEQKEDQFLAEAGVDASNINIYIKAIKDMRADNPRYKASMKPNIGPQQSIDSIVGARIVEKLAAIRNMPAQTAQQARGLLYQNEKGYLIQEMMYPDDTFWRSKKGAFQISAGTGDKGIRFRMPTLLDIGGDVESWRLIKDWAKAKEIKNGETGEPLSPYRGKWWSDWGGRMKSKEKYVEYIIFTPAGQYLSTHKTLDEANEELLRTIFPASMNDAGGAGPTQKGPVPSRAGIIKTKNDKVHYRYRNDNAGR